MQEHHCAIGRNKQESRNKQKSRNKQFVFQYPGKSKPPFPKANNVRAFLVEVKSTAYEDLGRKAFLTSLAEVSS